jgi:adenylate cyclase
MSRIQQIFAYFGLIMVSISLWIALSATDWLDGLEQEALRWRYLARGEMDSKSPVVFVNVDPRTVARMGDKPWNRLNFAQTVGALLGPGEASAVGVDIIFSSMGTGSLLNVAEARKGDLRFGGVVEHYSGKLVLAAAYTGTSEGVKGLPLKRYGYEKASEVPFPEAPTFPIVNFDSAHFGLVNVDEALNEGLVPYKVPAIIETEGSQFSNHLLTGYVRHYSESIERLELVTEDGLHNIVDLDGFVKLDPIPVHSSHRFLTLGLEIFLASNGLDSENVEWTADSLKIHKDGQLFREVPLIQGQTMEVNWLHGWDINRPDTHYSMAEVQEQADALVAAAGNDDAEALAESLEWFQRFKNKVIFIGGVDATLKDLAPTPFNRAPMPKVALHANAFRTVDAEAYITEVAGFRAYCVIAILAASVAGLLLWSGRGRLCTRILSATVLAGYAGYAFYIFGSAGVILPLIAPVGASVSAAMFVVLFKLSFEERQRRRIKNMFGAYVSPSLVNDMIESERDPELGGTQVAITALFSDVVGFSALSEELSPHELVALMNEYLGAMTETFQEEKGTLDKYIGDAIVTMFGMPYPVEDHAARACRSAILMQKRHGELRARWSEEGKWPSDVLNMRTRIGVNTGEAVIGNMGSAMRFNYTMMGDSVNLAARCESGAKSYGVYTMVTADTLHAALNFGEVLSYRKLDRIIVKGRQKPVEIYELWDSTVDQSLVEPCRSAYEAALDAYFECKWEVALAGFDASLEYEPARAYAPTTPSAVLAARCREFIQDGAPENWDGAYRMTSK